MEKLFRIPIHVIKFTIKACGNKIILNLLSISGKLLLICQDGRLHELSCEPGELFNAWTGFCEPEDQVVCLNGYCPPPTSAEIRYLPSSDCNHYYICFNGYPFPRQCGPGLHWNAGKDFCDNPKSAGCDVIY